MRNLNTKSENELINIPEDKSINVKILEKLKSRTNAFKTHKHCKYYPYCFYYDTLLSYYASSYIEGFIYSKGSTKSIISYLNKNSYELNKIDR